MQKNYRKCQACASIKPKEELIKIAKISPNSLVINPKSDVLSRSAYVCKNIDCIKTLIKKKRLKNALKFNNFDEIKRIEEILLNLGF